MSVLAIEDLRRGDVLLWEGSLLSADVYSSMLVLEVLDAPEGVVTHTRIKLLDLCKGDVIVEFYPSSYELKRYTVLRAEGR